MYDESKLTHPLQWVTHLFVCCIAVLCFGCANGSDVADSEAPTTAYIMDPMLDSAAEVFWDSAGFIDTYEGTTDLSPTTDEGWQRISDAADNIDQISAQLREERYSLNRPAWIQLSSGLVDAAERGRRAALDRDADELFEAGAQLYQVCVACHQAYWSNNRFSVVSSEAP